MYEEVKVSIITPVFNDEKYIADTLKSILFQTHSNLEIIVVNDHSNDKSEEVIKSFNDKRIKLINNDTNMGAAFSRNVALSKATGDYIAFLDGDDIWSKTKIEKQLAFMIENNIDFSYTNYEEIDEEGVRTGALITGPAKITFSKMKRACYPGCLTVMFKKNIFPDLSIPSTIKKRNDYAMWLLLSKKATCYLFNETLAFYRKRINSISSGKKSRLFKYHVIVFREVLNYSKFRAFICALLNVLFYFYRKHKYRKKLSV